jgi:hypothetical protein
MAVLSFAHLKNQSAQQTSRPVPPAPTSRVIAPAEVAQEVISPAVTNPAQLQRPRGMGIIKTALLASVNYCEGCPRFWPADENEKTQGVLYGRCCRVAGWRETWQIIPVTAKVSRCWYHLQQTLNEVKG